MTETRTSKAGRALVTGASTGIGREIARELVERGYDVVVAADEAEIQQAGAELGALAVQVDLATAEGVEELHARATEDGPIDVLALNAGVGVSGRFDHTTLDSQLNLVDLNVRSTVHLGHLVIREMTARATGRVLVTSSIAAVAPGPYHATYAASKAFVHSFAEGVREELKGTGVTITSLMPGPTDTEFFARAEMGDTKIGQMDDKDDPAVVARDGVEALLAGKASVVAGSFKNRIQAELGTHLPDALANPIFARMTKPAGEG
jgi:short-subunit dehydrogenase